MARPHRLPPPASWGKLRQTTLVERLDALRGMAWAYAVLYHTGLSGRAVSKKFTPKDHAVFDTQGQVVVSNIMYQYLDGKRPPTKGPRGKLKFDLVGEIDKHPQGRLATPWLTHPIFEVFHPGATLVRLREILLCMPSTIWKRLFRPTDEVDPLFDRIPEQDDMSRLAFFRMGTFDGLVAICALMREGFMIGNRRQAENSLGVLDAMVSIRPEIDPVFSYIASPFRNMVATFFDHEDLRMKLSLTPDDCIEMEIPLVDTGPELSGTGTVPLEFDSKMLGGDSFFEKVPSHVIEEWMDLAKKNPDGCVNALEGTYSPSLDALPKIR